MTWSSDSSGRHQERWHDGTGFTSRVRDHGIENDDPVGAERPVEPASIGAQASAAYLVSPGVPSGNPTTSVPSVTMTPPTTTSVPPYFGGSALPLAGPPASLTPPPVAAAAASTYDGERRFTGIPASLALATIIAACPMLIALVIGSYALMAGAAANDASNDVYSYQSSSSSGDPFDFTSADRQQLGGGLGDIGDAATNTGLIMVAVGSVGLLLALNMAQGGKAAMFVTALWMAGAVMWVLVQLADTQPTGSEWLVAAPLLVPPVIALLALCTTSSQAVFKPR